MSLNIGIIGIGGVGGYFGGKLCRLISPEKVNVHFVARGQHLNRIRERGLVVKTMTEGEWTCHPTTATDQIEDLPNLDICLICVKSYDLPQVIQSLRSRVTDTTVLLPLLNGIDIYDRIRSDLHVARIFPGCVFIGTHIETPGTITQKGGACNILFGKDPQAKSVVPQHLFELFAQSTIKYEWLGDVAPALWQKYIFIAAFSMVGASFDKTLGEILETPRLSAYVQSVMHEITQLAKKKGIVLPDNIIAESYEKGRDFGYETKTSFQRDFEQAEKPDERDLFGGAILRLGAQLGIGTPVTQELWEILEKRKPFPSG